MTSRRLAPFVVFSIAGLLTCAPCGASQKTGAIGQIDHIVIIVQENRSFDNLFEGFPHAHSSPTGKLPNGGTTRLKPVSLAAPYDISHAFQDAKTAYDRGRMDGFAYEYTGISGSLSPVRIRAARRDRALLGPRSTIRSRRQDVRVAAGRELR